MSKSSEKIALIILIPMIILTLIMTLSSKTQANENTSKQTFFNLKSQKDIEILFPDSITDEFNNIESINLLHIQE